MAKRWTQQDVAILSSEEQLKALAHKDRLAMLSILSTNRMTGAQVAARIGIPANRAQYHLVQLAEHGLVREVGRGRKRWKEERYFLASAKHYVVDPSLALQDPETALSIRNFIDQAFNEWREREVLGVDLGRFASQVVNQCLHARPGDVVSVMFGPQGLEFAEAVIVELEAIGARPRPKLWSRNYLFRTLDRHTSDSLAKLPFFNSEDLAGVNRHITINTGIPQGAPPNEEQMAKLPYRLNAVTEWQRTLRDRRIPYLAVQLLQRGMLTDGLVSVEDAIDRYWRCVATDYAELTRRAGALLARIGGKSRVRITSKSGTDFTVEVDASRPHINDGLITDDDVEAGRSFDHLPAGSLMFLPVRGGGDGVIVGDYTFVAKRFRDVRAKVKDGLIEELESANSPDALRHRVFSAAGDGRRIAVVRFGLNPAGGVVTGHEDIDECLAGVVSVSFGNNEPLGGDVNSTVDLTLVLSAATVEVDGVTLVSNGRLAAEVES